MKRAEANGYTGIVATIDNNMNGKRPADLKNGLSIPLRITPKIVLDGVLHPQWTMRMLSTVLDPAQMTTIIYKGILFCSWHIDTTYPPCLTASLSCILPRRALPRLCALSCSARLYTLTRGKTHSNCF